VEHEGTRFIREFIQFEGRKVMNQGRHHPKSSFAVLDLAEQSEEH